LRLTFSIRRWHRRLEVEKGNAVVAPNVPLALAERLGPDATKGFTELLVAEHRAWTERIVTTCTDRFERRLVEETSKLRVELSEMKADLRQEMATGRVELLKWAFLFWVGQLAGVGALMSLLLRTLPAR
jgi:hypothetical protein